MLELVALAIEPKPVVDQSSEYPGETVPFNGSAETFEQIVSAVKNVISGLSIIVIVRSFDDGKQVPLFVEKSVKTTLPLMVSFWLNV